MFTPRSCALNATAVLIDTRNFELSKLETRGPISIKERAEQAAILQFPDVRDNNLRSLAYREQLVALTGVEIMSEEEKAELFSARQFPRPGSRTAEFRKLTGPDYTVEKANHLRELARRELLEMQLTGAEEAELFSWRQCPTARRGQKLAYLPVASRFFKISMAVSS